MHKITVLQWPSQGTPHFCMLALCMLHVLSEGGVGGPGEKQESGSQRSPNCCR